jgi:hypothetical protein
MWPMSASGLIAVGKEGDFVGWRREVKWAADARVCMKKNRVLILLSLMFLGPIKGAMALNLGQLLGGAGIVAKGMQESENRVLQNRLLELQVQEANRMAVIQQLEYQRRIRELDEAKQRELQRQQMLNVDALRKEQARVAEIQAALQRKQSEEAMRQDEQRRQQVNAEALRLRQTRETEVRTPPQVKEAEVSISSKLAEISGRLRSVSPRQVNSGVRLMGASSKSDKLYLLIQLETIDVNSDSYKKVNDELQNQISGAIVTTCLDQSLEPLTRQGAVVRYSFFDAKQVFVEAIDTDKRDCLELLGTR